MKKLVLDIITSSRAFRPAACLLLLMIFFSSRTNAQQYDINDPRNPDCPCHKMQELADKEFALLNGFNNLNDDNVGGSKQDNQEKIDRLVDKKSTVVYNYTDRKRRPVWIKKTVFKISNKYRFKKKGKINVAICYKW